ncbi:MAG: cytosolic long-chain acyl-CoA thioester hydrolase family protein [Bacillota bacterium]|nr:cytosolic long-chain acyl-CoA thioester hydrolase family protein [Bacillota bacterium]
MSKKQTTDSYAKRKKPEQKGPAKETTVTAVDQEVTAIEKASAHEEHTANQEIIAVDQKITVAQKIVEKKGSTKMKYYKISHLVKSEDLNHHGTLFAGRSAEWLVEAAFVAAASQHGRPQDVLCVNIHGFTFTRPVQKGDIITFYSRVAKVGTTSITVYVKVMSEIHGTTHVDGYLTFVCVEPDTKRKRPHGIVMDETTDEEELQIRQRAETLSH